MARKFKHKLTNFIAEEITSGKNYKVFNPRQFTIPKWIIEESSDWEEVIDWDALLEEAKRKYPIGTKYISPVSKNEYIVSANPTYKINSDCYGLSKAGIEVAALKGWIYYNGKWAEIIEPLFVTEDGVKLYDGDRYWVVPTEGLPVWSDKEIFTVYGEGTILLEGKDNFAKGVKLFSTKQAAEAWIKKNKPVELCIPNESTIIAPPYTEYVICISTKNSNYINLVSNDYIVYKKYCTIKKANEMLKANIWKLKEVKSVEKEYEILESEYVPGHRLHAELSPKSNKIIKVKRLSDGQIFSLDDLVTYKLNPIYLPWTIDNFIITKEGCLARNMDNTICELITTIKYVKESKKYSLYTIIDKIECCKNRVSISNGGEFIQTDELIEKLENDKT